MHGHGHTVTIKKLPHSEVEITGEFPTEELERAFVRVLEKKTEEAEVPGFRKGKAPKNVVLSRIGEWALLESAAETLLGDHYPHIVAEHGLLVVSRPTITLTRLARGNSLGFKITVSIFPEVSLPNYKKTVREFPLESTTPVTEEDIQKVLGKLKAFQKKDTDRGDGGPASQNTIIITDEFAKQMGNFKDAADFRTRLTLDLQRGKEQALRNKRRLNIIEKILEETAVDAPAVFIESEIDRMSTELEADTTRAGHSFETYLSKIGKTKENLRSEWRDAAKKRVKLQIILQKIAEAEKLSPEALEIERHVKELSTKHQNTDTEQIRDYVRVLLTNEKVYEFFEKAK